MNNLNKIDTVTKEIYFDFNQLGDFSVFYGMELNNKESFFNFPENVSVVKFIENETHPAKIKKMLAEVIQFGKESNKKIVLLTHSLFVLREILLYSDMNVVYFSVEDDGIYYSSNFDKMPCSLYDVENEQVNRYLDY